jgi:glutathione peroxidase|tara:strand:+ start:80 stop:673 length:594 start_codon:yes stop_codon:yes gene_type:complete
MKKIILLISVFTFYYSCKETKTVINNEPTKNEQKMSDLKRESIYNFEYMSPKGETQYIKNFTDKVILIVNTATKCGFTSQFEGLEKLHTTYSEKGLVVLGFPCNQFGGQEPLSDKEMVSTCKKNHGVTFELTKKIDVNGERQLPLYQFLKSKQKLKNRNEIRWNFEKFLVNKQGEVVKRYSSKTTPAEITAEIEELL